MRKILVVTALSIGLLGLAIPAAQAAPSPKSNPLTCFSGTQDTADNPGYGPYNGTCVRKGSAFTLNNTDGDADPNNAYSGVYVASQSLAGTPVNQLNVGFTYSGATYGGSPRFSIPTDLGYLFIDTSCDANMDGIVSTTEPGCIVQLGSYYGPISAAPGTVIAGLSFIVADQPGIVIVSEIKLGRTSPGKI